MDLSSKDRFLVEGGRPVGGSLQPSGNKNEALPVLAASLLLRGRTRIQNLPRIRDVATMLQLLRAVGASVCDEPGDGLVVDASRDLSPEPDPALAGSIRGSFLLAPALLHRTGRAILPRPGGDRIGRRRIDTHLLALRLMGASVEVGEDVYRLRLEEGFLGGEIFLDEASVMATENALMAAAVARGPTCIQNAASEPHVQGLCQLLQGMGVVIRGVGTNRLQVEGVQTLQETCHVIRPDHIEIGSFMALAAMTGGALTVRGVIPEDLRMIRMVYRRLGVKTRIEGRDLLVPGGQILEIQDDIHGAIPKVDDAPWPGFPADLTSMALVLATQSRGTVLIHEKLFESRLFFVDRLIAMGARVVLCDPHRAVVVGPAALHGEPLASPDIRAGMALLAAALCAEGSSTIMNAGQVDRGYERIEERLRDLGASIQRIVS